MLDVLIVGAGPSGLTLAIELARRGVAYRLIDAAPAPFSGSRGKGLQPRTLEILDHMGVIRPVMQQGGLYPYMRMHFGPFAIRVGSLGAHGPATEARPYPNLWMLPQARTEDILRERLAQVGGKVEFGIGLVAFTQDDKSVSATLSTGETATAAYLAGCDGGRSTVRTTLGLTMQGEAIDDTTSVVADVEMEGLDREYWHFWLTKGWQRVGLCPLPNSNLFQLQAPASVETEGLETGLQRITGHRVARVVWHSVYRHNARMVDRYRVGRVLLVGDAAHIHPPAGGQGLNTGMQDAWNLGWKLAWIVRGGRQSILDSYERERMPVAAHVLRLTKSLYSSGSRKRGSLTNQLDLNYRDSPLSTGGEAHGLFPGDHMPDARLPDGGRLYDVLREPGATRLAYRDGTRILLRPDAYIASTSNDPDSDYAGGPIRTIELN